MKKNFLILVLILVVLASPLVLTGCSKPVSSHDIIGTWQRQDNPNNVLEIKSDGTFTRTIGEGDQAQVINGRWDFDSGNERLRMWTRSLPGWPNEPDPQSLSRYNLSFNFTRRNLTMRTPWGGIGAPAQRSHVYVRA